MSLKINRKTHVNGCEHVFSRGIKKDEVCGSSVSNKSNTKKYCSKHYFRDENKKSNKVKTKEIVIPTIEFSEHPIVKGLYFAANVLTEEEEFLLLANMEREPGHVMPRTPTANEFGWRYINTIVTSQLTVADHRLGVLPDWMVNLWRKCVTRIPSLPVEVQRDANQLPDHGIVNHYTPNGGCSHHLDHPTFWGDWVLGVSLVSGSTLVMTRINPSLDDKPVEIYLPPRSIYFFTGDSRFKWTHGIPSRAFDLVDGKQVNRGSRKSITLRRIMPEFLTPKLLNELNHQPCAASTD